MALMAVALASSGIAGEARARKPRLEVRTSVPSRMAPVQIVAIAELVGGEDLEEFYCTGLEWDWGDGSRSFRESDCDPFAPGTEVDRFFSARHAYRAPGLYNVRIRLRRAGHDVALARTQVMIPGSSLARAW
jgi:hypothetical protein